MVRAVPLAAALLVLAACGGDDGVGAPDEPEPDAVRLAATATRSSLFDSGRTFRLELANEGDDEVVVDTIQLRSPRFEELPPSDRDTELAPGRRLLLPLPYGPSTCPGGDEAPVVVAVVAGQEIEVPLDQHPASVMADLHAVECDQQAVAEAATITLGDEWNPTGPRSAAGVVVVTPGDDTAVRVEAMTGNIVFGVRLAADALPATATFPVELVVDRCDTHALIESKRTFTYPLEVTLDDGDAVTYVLEAEPGTPARAVLGDLIEACIGEG